MQISFLIHNGYGIGGTIRTTFTLAETLAEHHDVEIVSVFRHRDTPVFDLGPGVRLRHLVDMRKNTPGYEGDDPAHRRPSRVFPVDDNRYPQYSALTDERIGRFLKSLDSDVVVGTRPGLNVHIALQCPSRVVRVAQEHLTLDVHPPMLNLRLRSLYPRMDALTTVTEADAEAYRRRMRLPGVRIEAVPNGVPEPGVAPGDGTGRYVVAAGRLAPVKRYDMLVRAFGKVVRERPDWKLRIYGGGEQKERLRSLIDRSGLYNHVYLMGPAAPLEAEWVKGSIAAVTSSLESFGMTIVEAMRCGLPVVSTACPHGPREIIRDGVDGRLVPPGDADAMASALLELINDDVLRRRMGRAALSSSARFDPGEIAARYEDLFDDLVRGHRGAGGVLRSLGRETRGRLLSGAYTVTDTARRVKRSIA
ncbi:hypothetical protein GCM10010406_39090 [Streptomyces thermolineatus]|uniref:D-inositol 3-phosphate glycosyltransferase n=1 Tax=Streptomyces thermolineatus TaxID=44033 RepID=A0ABN3MAZ9_9ACTN